MIYAEMTDKNSQAEIDEQLKATEKKKWYRRLNQKKYLLGSIV